MDRVQQLERELRGAQEMLFFVLQSVGAPVEVTKEQMESANFNDQMINVEDDMQRNSFVFSIVELNADAV